MSIYCTYITFYRGNKLPPFYIGSTTVEKINNGYHGTVTSKEYKNIWKSELKENLHLFKTKIISIHDNRVSALDKEFRLQKQLKVVKSSMYINKSLASKNGFFGMSVTKEKHHSYGGTEWNEKRKIEHGIKRSNYFKNNKVIWINKDKISKHISEKNLKKYIDEGWSIGRKPPRIIVKTQLSCPHCGATSNSYVFKYSHFDRCKYHPDRLELTLVNEKLKYYEFYGKYYKTYDDLYLNTGCSVHLYMKYYKNGIDPRPYFNSRNYPIVKIET